jgi:hypothetical protein
MRENLDNPHPLPLLPNLGEGEQEPFHPSPIFGRGDGGEGNTGVVIKIRK